MALIHKGSVSLTHTNTWLASILWPHQDESDAVLTQQLRDMELAELELELEQKRSTTTNRNTNTNQHGYEYGTQNNNDDDDDDDDNMLLFRIKGVISVQYSSDDIENDDHHPDNEDQDDTNLRHHMDG